MMLMATKRSAGLWIAVLSVAALAWGQEDANDGVKINQIQVTLRGRIHPIDRTKGGTA